MAVPKKKHTKSRRNKRRSHHALKKQQFSLCQKCKSQVLSHTLCLNCGTYNNREIIDVLAKLTKKERRKKEKEMTAEKERPESSDKGLTMEGLSKKGE